MSKFRGLKEFFKFLGENKKLWLIPIIIIFILIGIVLLVSQKPAATTVLHPF